MKSDSKTKILIVIGLAAVVFFAINGYQSLIQSEFDLTKEEAMNLLTKGEVEKVHLKGSKGTFLTNSKERKVFPVEGVPERRQIQTTVTYMRAEGFDIQIVDDPIVDPLSSDFLSRPGASFLTVGSIMLPILIAIFVFLIWREKKAKTESFE